jgi:hypothetical protein
MTRTKADKTAKTPPNVQGEGDYEATRRYRKDVEEFVKTQDIESAARNAAPKSDAEKAEMERAEHAGLARSKAPTGSADHG